MRAARLLAATALVLASTAGTASAVDHSKGSPGYCPDANGVTVVIDFQDLGGDVLIRCAPGPQGSGLAALQNSGIQVAGVDRWGLAFICRIEGKPGPDTEACIDTPPPSAYWSYWHAPNGGNWTYSSLGVMNRKPPTGSFEGWSFSRNRAAGSNPTPRVAPVRPGQPVGPAPSPGEQNGAIPGRDGVPKAAPPPAAPKTTAPSTPASTTTTPPASSTTSTPPPPPPPAEPLVGGVAPGGVAWTGGQDAQPVGESGFPWGAVLGGAAVLVIGGAAGFTAWRRRRAG
ncbi:hypothetical protein [Amycolatopsis suaedae]|uniref:ABC transporter substrate-binding protein n=1 Tax=Amycolatopsis suaedae TaxID=2510978 RepID=A0A4Q7JBS8_9PSEU|nr:hypothetical protein [Amycolatopsis suaedae]RZQ65300.1 hypothetical protein EWH70_05320 [Amycolatopsis suaedae]